MNATKLMERMFELTTQYRDEVADPEEYAIHLTKAGGMVAAVGLMLQLQIPPQHAERMYLAAVDGMASEAGKIRGES